MVRTRSGLTLSRMPSLPTPLKAALGLAASAVDEVRHIPGRALEFPMTALSTALQMSLRAQQRYSELAARGDAVLNRTSVTDTPPPWASFEPTVDADDPATFEDGPFDDAKAAARLLDSLMDVEDRPLADIVPLDDPEQTRPARKVAPRKTAPRKAPARKAAPAPKTVRAPRNAAPSKFDAATFEDDE